MWRILWLALLLFCVFGCAAPPENSEMLTTGYAVLTYGQSLAEGTLVGETGTYPGCRYWKTSLSSFNPDANAFSDLTTGFGRDVTLGRILLQAGVQNLLYLNIAKGATTASQWNPPNGSAWTVFSPELDQALAAIPAEKPGIKHWVFFANLDQGQDDARSGNTIIVDAWLPDHEAAYAAIVAKIDAWATAHGFTYRVEKILNRTSSTIANKTFPGRLEALQDSWAANVPADSRPANRTVDETVLTYGNDNVHPDQPGYIQLGVLDAQRILEVINMGSLSVYSRNKIGDHGRNVAPYSPAANHYYAAFIAGVEVTDANYSRKLMANNSTTYAVPSARAVANAIPILWPSAAADYSGPVDEVRIFDAPTGTTNELGRHTLAGTKIITAGKSLALDPGDMIVTGALGGWVDTIVNSALGLLFGARAWSALATVFPQYILGDPSAGGTPLGSRVSYTQASTWGSFSGGVSATTVDIAITDQASATYWAEYDASSSGNLIFFGALPQSPVGGKMPAFGLQTVLA